VQGGATDCPYTFMQDMVAGRYQLPWDASVQVKDGSPCGFAAPTRAYGGAESNPFEAAVPVLKQVA
jgi:formamidase